MRPLAQTLFAALAVSLALTASASAATLSAHARTLLASAGAWSSGSVAAIGHVRDTADPLESAANILAFYCDPQAEELTLRVSLVAPVGIQDHAPVFADAGVRIAVLLDEGTGANTALPAPLSGTAPIPWDRVVFLDAAAGAPAVGASASSARPSGALADHLDAGWMAAAVPAGGSPRRACVLTFTPDGRVLDQLVAPLGAQQTTTYTTNVAFVHHGNQGLAYSNVFLGRSGSESTSGFDEILRVHQTYNVPGNFHLSALDQTSAEWNHQNGDPLDFNGWLRAGVTAGWADMVTSVYGQAITPFLQGDMTDWAISRDVAMVTARYGYVPHVAWIPERTFLDPSTYPNAGVIDWSGAHWQANGVNGVIVDDWPHCSGHNSHQIHFLQGNGLRLIPRDGNFTGKLHSGDGAGALAILTGEAGSGQGQYRITVYADDWEMAAAMGGWETTFPYAFGTYQWMIQKCSTESAWLNTWKLDAALSNADFNGDTFTPTYGTYGGIGDVQGYGGSNNAWYSDWAGFVPYSTGGNGSGGCAGTGGNCKNHGTLWNDAHYALTQAPNNNLREAGWYVLMSNLHETAWHDYLGGPLSGWERQYSAHMKSANVYAEAAHWAGGQYATTTGCFLTDIDDDGINELVIYNDRLFGVFESVGGRCTQLFAKGSNYDYSVVGIDNAYWAGTEGDYNDVNHIAALSDVGPNDQNDLYGLNVDVASGNTVQASFTHSGLTKIVKLTLGQPYLDCIYKVGATTQYIQSGFSPDLIDLLYNAHMDRIWGGSTTSYMGQRDPNTGATAAYVLGGGGAAHNLNFASTLMKVDEIKGTQKFEFYLYGGYASAPDSLGHVAELQSLSSALTDQLPPEAVSGTYFPATHQLALTFDEPVQPGAVVMTSIKIDANNDGLADVTLDAGCSVLTGGNSATLTIAVSTAVNNAMVGLANKNNLKLLLTAGAVRDVAGNLVATLTNAGNVPVSYGPPTLITLDGYFNPSEWPVCTVAVADSFDSGWNSPPNTTNEIQALYATWDSTYLYPGIRGVATGNSWLLYIDTDPGGANGQTDLTAINAWARGAKFTATGFKPDWEFGAYQHQGQFDSQSFFKLLSATTTANYSDSILKSFDPMHNYGLNGGSEIAIPWSVLYGLGAGRVPANARIGLVSSLCWDPEPSGQLGGDQAPNNISAVAPTLDNFAQVTIDANGDGLPDVIDRTPPSLLSAAPTGWDSLIVLQFSEPLTSTSAGLASHYTVYQTGNPTATLEVRSATPLGNGSQVRLLVSHMSYVPYTVLATGVADTSCFHNTSSGSSAAFQGPPVSVDPAAALPRTLALSAPWPSPSHDGRAALTYELPGGEGEGAPVTLALYDLVGRRVRTVVDGAQLPGTYHVALDGLDAAGRRLAPGLYFVRISRGASQQTRRWILMP